MAPVTARQLSAAYRVAEILVRPPLWLLTRPQWHGGENLPASGGFLACVNHISHVDPFTLGRFLLDHGCPPRFLAKEEIFRIPVLGRIPAGAGQIPVYRETADAARAFSAAEAAVAAGECVTIYPEATITRDPGLWPMVAKTGAARIALATGCPVIPIAQWGPQRLLAPYAKLPRLTGRTTIQGLVGPPVDLSRYLGRTPDAELLRAATATIMDAITRLLEQLRGEQAPAARWDPREHDLPRVGNPRRGGRRSGREGAA